jgi:hypothetical protein
MEFKDVITDPAHFRELRAPPPCVAETIAIVDPALRTQPSACRVVICGGETS